MLDVDSLIAGMEALAGEVVLTAERTHARLGAVREQLRRAARMAPLRGAVQAFVREARRDMALPRAGGDMAALFAPPAADGYTILATDGSQIPPDYHHVAPWYVIHPGFALFRYDPPNGRPRHRLGARPILRPPGGAPADEASDALGAAVGAPPRIEMERLEAELDLALKLLETEADPGRTVLLLDGPLVQWRMITDLRGPEKQRLIGTFRCLMDRAHQRDTAVAGYVSGSRAVQWATLLRFSLCPDVEASGELCPDCRATLLDPAREPLAADHHAPLAALRDVQVAGLVLGTQPGARTEVIELHSSAWREISGRAEDAGFFYLNAGAEVARVEIPRWVWEEPALLDRLHAALWDQCRAGGGYPMVLAEAHEAAVLRAGDRATFRALIERLLNEHGAFDLPTPKAQSKRRPAA